MLVSQPERLQLGDQLADLGFHLPHAGGSELRDDQAPLLEDPQHHAGRFLELAHAVGITRRIQALAAGQLQRHVHVGRAERQRPADVADHARRRLARWGVEAPKEVGHQLRDRLAGAPGDVKINITKYEPVGGVIEGTFSGTFQVQDLNKAPTGATVKITEGKFSVLRYPDAE